MAEGRCRVLVAPDSFTGSLTAREAAAAIGAGVADAAAARGCTVVVDLLPVADGGEGTVAVLAGVGWDRLERVVPGPTGIRGPAGFVCSPAVGWTGRRTAVVDLAEACGLTRLPPPGPTAATARQSSTEGMGDLVRAALDLDVEVLVLCLGGSASTDGGSGLAAALGVRFLDAGGRDLAPGGAALAGLERIVVSGLDPRLHAVDLLVTSDVDNPLTGPTGAAQVFGPQKGAGPADVLLLDAALGRLHVVALRDLGVDLDAATGAGAAGGTAGGAVGLLGARPVAGAELLLDLLGLPAALRHADVVVTGEGSFDAQSLRGKAPVAVARRAAVAGVPVLMLAGRVDRRGLDAAAPGWAARLPAYGLTDGTDGTDGTDATDGERAQREAAPRLRALAAEKIVPFLTLVGGSPPRRPGTGHQ